MKRFLKKNMKRTAASIALCLMFPALLSCNREDPTAAGVSYLSDLETRDVASLLQTIRDAEAGEEATMPPESEETAPQTDVEETTAPPTEQETTAAATQAAVQEPVPGEDAVDLTAEELGRIRRAFDRTVVIGDSLTQALIDYELLDASHVFYKRGATLRELGETTDRAIVMYPENVIFFKGLNDVDHESYDSYPAAFAERVDQVLQALPNAKVYVCALLPPSNAVGAAREDLARAPVFDQFLESWCATRPDVTYVELDWMVRQDWYMADGIHFKKPFYAVWLKYLAEILNGQ